MPSVLNKTLNLILCLFFFTLLFGNDKAVIQNLASKYYKSATFTAVIKQSNSYKAQNKTLLSEGVFIKQNNIFLLDFSKPYKQFIHFNNPEIIIYDSSLNTAHIMKNDNYKSFNPEQLFSELYNGNFTMKRQNELYIVKITFSHEQTMSFTLKINEAQSLLEMISYKDSMDNTVKITFSKQKFNTKLNRNLHNSLIPKNARIINL